MREVMMEEVERLVATSMGEIEKLLSSKTVVGEPITAGDTTIIPLITIGFAFVAGGGAGKGSGKGETGPKGEGSGEGTVGGTGGGGGIKPCAVVIIDKDSVRVESVKGSFGSVLDRFGETVGKVVEKRVGKEVE